MASPPIRLVLGLTGPNASGKGEAVEILRARGYRVHSLSDIVREEATRLGRDHSRDSLIRTGREMRRAGGPGILARSILDRLVPPCVVDSIRNPGEVEELRRMPAFRLLGITAPAALRFERIRLRNRPGDPESLAEFLRKEEIENSTDPEGQRLDATMERADGVLPNEGSLEDLRERLGEIVAGWEEETA